MRNFFTFVGNTSGMIQIGSVLELKASPDNPNGVDGYIDGRLVGHISGDANLLIGRACRLNKQIRESAINHPGCAAAYGLVMNYEPRRVGNNTVYLYGAELYAVPVRNTKDKKVEVYQYKAGGITAENPKKTYLMGDIRDLEKDGKPVRIPVEILHEDNSLELEKRYAICRPDAVVIGAAAGRISDPDEFLENLIPEHESRPATVVGASGRFILVEIEPQTGSIEKFYPSIDAAVARCAGQCRAIEEKVETMIAARFDDTAIEMVLSQMSTVGATGKVPKPKTKYTQKKGNNLSDMVSYMTLGKMVRLVGEKGSGKNTLIETACWLLNRPMCRVQGSAELDKMDLLGSRTLKNGNTGFELSEFLTTLRNDGIAVIDEANTVRPEVLTILHSLTDGARSIDVPGYGSVKMGPHACILYTMNEDYVGTGEMNPATIDRGPSMFIEQESDMSELLKIAVPNASADDIKLCCKVSDEIRKATKSGSGTLTGDAITVRGYIDALQSLPYIPLRRSLIQNVANKAQTPSERQAMEAIISANIA